MNQKGNQAPASVKLTGPKKYLVAAFGILLTAGILVGAYYLAYWIMRGALLGGIQSLIDGM